MVLASLLNEFPRRTLEDAYIACNLEGGGRELAELSLIVVEPPESLAPLTRDSREEFPWIDMFFIIVSVKEVLLFLMSMPFMSDSRELEVEEPGADGVPDLTEGFRNER